MPGIALLEWPAQDLRSAAIDYIQSRQTFASVGDKPADLTLTVKAWLTMRSRGNYRLQSAPGISPRPFGKAADQVLSGGKRNGEGRAFGGSRLRIRPPLQKRSKLRWTICSRRSKPITSCIEKDRAERQQGLRGPRPTDEEAHRETSSCHASRKHHTDYQARR